MDGTTLPLTEAERTVASERPTDPDAQTVQRVLRGDTDAFGELVRRHQRGLYFLCLRYLRHEQDAADLSQRALLRAYEKLGSFSGRAAFRTWLYRIAVNLCLNALRDGQRRSADPLDEQRVGVAADQHRAAERADERRRLWQAVEQLPPKQRMTVILRVYQDLSFAEVAEIMGNSVNSAKVNFHHAMKRLQRAMGDEAAP